MGDFVKLGDLVDQDIVIKRVNGYKFVAWDNDTNSYIKQDEWFKGASKKFQIETDKGLVDISAGHVGNMFESVQHGGQSNINGATFHVKSNGKTGIDIRYFFNPVKVAVNASEELFEEGY